MSRLAFIVLLSTLLLTSACAESGVESFDSSVETAVAQTVVAGAPVAQSPGAGTVEVQPNLPATVAAAFTATAESAPAHTSGPFQSYIPQLSDYIVVADELAGESVRKRNSLISKFDIISIMYWLDVVLGSEPASHAGFIAFALKTPDVRFTPVYVRDAANEQLRVLAAIAMHEPHASPLNTLVNMPSDEEALLICAIGVEAMLLTANQKRLLPPEPVCPVVIAEYRVYGSDSELGFLGYVGERFFLTLLP